MSDLDAKAVSQRVDLAQESAFELGGLTVRPSDLSISSGSEQRELQPRVMQVLVTLARARPQVVSRDQLVAQCWDGRIVGDDAINRCILALRNLAREFTPPPYSIETIPRVGYRLVERGTPPAEVALPQPTARPRRALHRYAAVVAAALLLLGLAGWWWANANSQPTTIAVLPFRDLSRSDPFLAEGIGEEILNRLADEPAFRVAGRTSSAQFRDAADLRKVGAALGVDYVIEGSVQTNGERIKVNASLIKAANGMRLWSQNYDRGLTDIFAIQQEIGTSVASTLRRTLDKAAPNRGSVARNGEAYRKYLSAKGMLRTRNLQFGEEAIGLLRQAIAADAGFAPAWASLADAVRLNAALGGNERVIAALPEAEAAARRALALDPDLAEAHGVLGALLGYRSHEAQRHLRRAAELEPHNPEAQLWLASAEQVSGNFEAEITAYRRAIELDPHWYRAGRDLAIALAEIGDRQGAEVEAARHVLLESGRGSATQWRVAWIYGDFAKAMAGWQAGAARISIWQTPAQIALSNARFTLGLAGAPPPRQPAPAAELRANLGRIWMPAAPTAVVWRERNRDVAATLAYDEENIVAAKLLLIAGRGGEIADAYGTPIGLLGLRQDKALVAADLHTAALVALALRAGGRTAAAEQLLARAAALGDDLSRRGRMPFALEADIAAIAAVAGEHDKALGLLERAERRGWSHVAPDDLLRLDDEPAYATLAEEPRFIALLARFDARIANERAKASKLGL